MEHFVKIHVNVWKRYSLFSIVTIQYCGRFDYISIVHKY